MWCALWNHVKSHKRWAIDMTMLAEELVKAPRANAYGVAKARNGMSFKGSVYNGEVDDLGLG